MTEKPGINFVVVLILKSIIIVRGGEGDLSSDLQRAHMMTSLLWHSQLCHNSQLQRGPKKC